MRKTILLLTAAVALAGCDHKAAVEQTAFERVRNDAQDWLNRSIVVCRDGIQYLATPAHPQNMTFTPRLKSDGTAYICKVTPVTFKQTPVDN